LAKKRVKQAGAQSSAPLSISRPPFPGFEFKVGLAVLAALCLAFWFSDLDLLVARQAWAFGGSSWPGREGQPWAALYRFGQPLALITGLLGLAAFVASFYSASPFWKAKRGPGIYLFVLLALGPGLLVNVLGKGLAGRPRPSDLLEFGGPWEFHRPFEFGVPGRGASFPSGHAAAAFYFFAFYFLWQGRKRWLAFFGTLAFGALMGTARILQGGHFLSDVCFSGCVDFILAAGLSPLIHWQPRAAFFKQRELRWAASAGILSWLWLSHPLYVNRSQDFPKAPALDLDLGLATGDIKASFGDQGQGAMSVSEHLEALSLPGTRMELLSQPLAPSADWHLGPQDLALSFRQDMRGLAWNVRASYGLNLDPGLACEARLKSPDGAITIGPLPKDRPVLLYGSFKPEALPLGFEPYGVNGYYRKGLGPLIVLVLNGKSVSFETP
jgi:membrane-associated PAP2 superfamily phosphatase